MDIKNGKSNTVISCGDIETIELSSRILGFSAEIYKGNKIYQIKSITLNNGEFSGILNRH